MRQTFLHINAFLVHSCKLSLVYYSFIVQEKRKRVLQSCFLARNLNIHHQSVNDKEGLPQFLAQSGSSLTNQMYMVLHPSKQWIFLSVRNIVLSCYIEGSPGKKLMWRGLAAVHTHAENMMCSYTPVEQMKSSSCTSPPSIYEEPLTLRQYGCTCY